MSGSPVRVLGHQGDAPSLRNGKAERFNRTMCDEWIFSNSQDRADGLPEWLHTQNHHRAHTALAGKPPNSRVNNGPDQYS